MMNQEFKVQGTKCQALPDLESVAWSLGDTKLRIFTHPCTVSVMPGSSSSQTPCVLLNEQIFLGSLVKSQMSTNQSEKVAQVANSIKVHAKRLSINVEVRYT